MKTLCECAEEIYAQKEHSWTEKFFKDANHFIFNRGEKTTSARPTAWAPEDLSRLGCRGDNIDGNLTFLFFDLDVGHGNEKHKYDTTDEALETAYKIREFFKGRASIRLSKSGKGVHVHHLVTGCEVPYEYGPVLAKGIANHLNIKCDHSVHGRQCCWFWERDAGPDAFKLIEEQVKGKARREDYDRMLTMFSKTEEPKKDTATVPLKKNVDLSDRTLHPADRYNANHTCREWLEKNDWVFVNTTMKQPENKPQHHFRRAGKDEGVSGNIMEMDGHEVFHCFTSSDPVLHPRAYNPFQMYSAYVHGGDVDKATQVLGREYEAEFKKTVDEPNFKFANSVLDKLLNLAPAPAQPNTDGWEIRSVRKTVRENTIVRPKVLIEGVCYRGGKISISAPSKGRKTFTLMHLAYCVATGTDWMGHKVNQGKVLYVNLELMDFSFFDRSRAIERNMNLNPNDTSLDDVFHEVNLRGKMVTIEAMQKFFQDKKPENYSLIIVDPLYKILGKRSENDASEMGDLLNRLENIAGNAGASLAVAHHFAKGNAAGKEIIDRHSGSGVVARDGDTIVTLTPHEEEDCFTMDFTLRDFEPVKPRVLRWQYPFFRADPSLDPEALKVPRGKVKAATLSVEDLEGAIYDYLENATEPKSIDEITLKVGHVHRTRTLIGLMVKAGKVTTQDVPNGKGRPTKSYTLTRIE